MENMLGENEWACVREILGEELLSVILPVFSETEIVLLPLLAFL